jgi:osmoprotectant transport system permease protein
MKHFLFFFIAILLFLRPQANADTKTTVTVGSKAFTESYILAEILARKLESVPNVTVIRKFGLGGTGIVYEALKKGEIDFYVEYTGTIREAILKSKANNENRSHDDLKSLLKPLGLTISRSIGFNNTYGLALKRSTAEKLNLRTISDLRRSDLDLQFAFSHEFSQRSDGLRGLLKKYDLVLPSQNVRQVSQALVYNALEANEIDVAEVYSTDAKIESLQLAILEDDQRYFPEYEAVILARAALEEKQPEVWTTLTSMEGLINNRLMQKLNAMADIDKQTFARVAATFLKEESGESSTRVFDEIWLRTKEHLALISIAIGLSIVFGLPIGIAASRNRTLGQTVLAVTSFFQTIPSLALLCFLVPLIGIGAAPALLALTLYGLLPVITGTYRGLTEINSKTIEYARTMRLTALQRLTKIELPLASPSILTGVQTSAIISVGTATIAALVGAGGYGTPIVTGLALNDNTMILQGALPSALLAIAFHYFFELLRLVFVPVGLRKSFRST